MIDLSIAITTIVGLILVYLVTILIAIHISGITIVQGFGFLGLYYGLNFLATDVINYFTQT